MPIRNPFKRTPDDPAEAAGAGSHGRSTDTTASANKTSSFERIDTVGSSASSRRSQDTGDYAMSVVDSGVYLPPSPTERDAFWSGPRRSYKPALAGLSRPSAERERHSTEQPFPISRESFDSYRRSFDISARTPASPTSPTSPTSALSRQSLDSATRRMPPPRVRAAAASAAAAATATTAATTDAPRFPPADEGFEDVGLDDKEKQPSLAAQNPVPMRKRPFFKFGAQANTAAGHASGASSSDSVTAPIGRLLGRKRAPSGQGAELKPMEKPEAVAAGDPSFPIR